MRKPRKPGRSADHKGRSKGRDPFVLLTKFMLASPAWQSLIAVERALLIEVMQRWSGFNNGSIGLGVLEAGRALHVKPQTIGFAFRELVKRGFLEKMRDSTFDQKKLTREWRVTCLVMGPSNAPTAPPTHDYMRWRPSPDDTR
jgi:hypothetical protein